MPPQPPTGCARPFLSNGQGFGPDGINPGVWRTVPSAGESRLDHVVTPVSCPSRRGRRRGAHGSAFPVGAKDRRDRQRRGHLPPGSAAAHSSGPFFQRDRRHLGRAAAGRGTGAANADRRAPPASGSEKAERDGLRRRHRTERLGHREAQRNAAGQPPFHIPAQRGELRIAPRADADPSRLVQAGGPPAGAEDRYRCEEVDEILARLKEAEGEDTYRLGEIFLAVNSPDEEASIRETTERLVEQIRGGARFGALARQFSQAATAAVGGDLGWTPRSQLDAEIAAAVDRLSPGAVLDPIRTISGFRILRLTGKRKIAAADPDRRSSTSNRYSCRSRAAKTRPECKRASTP